MEKHLYYCSTGTPFCNLYWPCIVSGWVSRCYMGWMANCSPLMRCGYTWIVLGDANLLPARPHKTMLYKLLCLFPVYDAVYVDMYVDRRCSWYDPFKDGVCICLSFYCDCDCLCTKSNGSHLLLYFKGKKDYWYQYLSHMCLLIENIPEIYFNVNSAGTLLLNSYCSRFTLLFFI